MSNCCPTSDFNPGEIDPGKCDKVRCTCLEARRKEPKACLCDCNYPAAVCARSCGNGRSTCACTGPREHDDDCDCEACMKIGIAYLREQVEILRDRLYQRDLKITQLCECINKLIEFDLNGEG